MKIAQNCVRGAHQSLLLKPKLYCTEEVLHNTWRDFDTRRKQKRKENKKEVHILEVTEKVTHRDRAREMKRVMTVSQFETNTGTPSITLRDKGMPWRAFPKLVLRPQPELELIGTVSLMILTPR